MGVGQGSALSPILSTLYLLSLLYILEKHLKTLNIPVSLISFVDDSLFGGHFSLQVQLCKSVQPFMRY